MSEDLELSGEDTVTANEIIPIVPTATFGKPEAPIWVVCEPANLQTKHEHPCSAASLNMFLNEAKRQGLVRKTSTLSASVILFQMLSKSLRLRPGNTSYRSRKDCNSFYRATQSP
jgi:hypothetical protein